MIAALNGLDIMACDLENVYLNTRCKEKILFEGRIECGANKVCIFVRALYGLKSAGASWHATLVQALHDIGFVSTTADPDVWIWAAVQGDGFEYYEMLFREVWASSPCDYVNNAIKTIESLFEEDGEGYVLKSKVKNLIPMNYKPKLDVLDELGPELSSHYLQLIGICGWVIELGHIDIGHEISLLSQYQANPRVGHLEVLYHVFAYLKNH